MNDLIFRTAELNPRRVYKIQFEPGADSLNEIAAEFDVSALRKLRFEGVLKARGKEDWQVTGRLGATVVQPCVVTLDPVTTRIEETIDRLFVAQLDLPDESEVEMPEDETVDLLGAEINIETVIKEALALAIPAYPRAEGAELGELVYTKPGAEALRDEDVKPFAGLAALKDKLSEKK